MNPWYSVAMKTISLDLRERILSSYDAGEGTREDIAKRYKVSLGMVKKLLQQRSKTGDIRPRHRFSGRKPKITQSDRDTLKRLVDASPDLTLAQLRKKSQLDCTVQAIHYVLKGMGLTYKKKRSEQASKTART